MPSLVSYRGRASPANRPVGEVPRSYLSDTDSHPRAINYVVNPKSFNGTAWSCVPANRGIRRRPNKRTSNTQMSPRQCANLENGYGRSILRRSVGWQPRRLSEHLPAAIRAALWCLFDPYADTTITSRFPWTLGWYVVYVNHLPGKGIGHETDFAVLPPSESRLNIRFDMPYVLSDRRAPSS